MATYKITAPDGNSYNVTAPDGASQDQVLSYAKSNYQKAQSPKMGGKAPLGAVIGQVMNSTPWAKLQQGLRTMGGNIAEYGGKKGFPKTGVALGAIPAIGPDVLSAVTGIEGLETSEAPLAQAIRKTPQMLGKEIPKGNVSGNLPIQRGTIPKFEDPYQFPGLPRKKPQIPAQALPTIAPKEYPSQAAPFINSAKARVDQFGPKLNVQELDDYKSILRGYLDPSSKNFVGFKTPEYAQASDLNRKVTSLHNAAIPGRQDWNKVYGLSKAIRPLSDPKITKKIFPALGVAGAGGIGAELIRKLIGQ